MASILNMAKVLSLLIASALLATAVNAQDRDATTIVRDAVNHWRGLSSDSVMTMVIHRPDWERAMTMRAWTKGDDRSLVRVLEALNISFSLDSPLMPAYHQERHATR